MAAPGERLPFVAMGFGLAAALSSWNPLSAPFAVVVGAIAALLAARGLSRARDRHRVVAAIAAVISLLAVVAGVGVLAVAAGVGRDLGGTPVVQAPARRELSSELDRAAERSRAARDRARSELERLEPPPAPGAPSDGGGRAR